MLRDDATGSLRWRVGLRWTGTLIASILLLALVAPAGLAVGTEDPEDDAPEADPAAAIEDAPAGDGQSEESAAASCWEIKQNDPDSESGVYWLVTPSLGAPEQFYCDQVTDGGGWVLIGRGRENWSKSNEGRLTPEDVRDTTEGSDAFSPAQLPVDTINGLLDGGRVDELDDGVRLRRATNTEGTSWQEAQFHYSTNRDDWSWQFAGVQGVGDWSFDESTGQGGTTGDFGSDSTFRRVDTRSDGTRGWTRGFAFGSAARGSPASDSYLWAPSTTAGYPRPFTQVFLRPELSSEDIFTSIPDDGLPEETLGAAAESYPIESPWGVTGLGASGSGELNTEVAAFAESSGVMYVGGNFRYVQRNSAGSGRVEQSYLAAFDATTGEWISDFRPTLDDQVKAIEVLPDGRIAVGGAFQTVDGEDSPAFTVLDPTTGEADSSVTTRVINYTGGAPPVIRTMDIEDGHLYIGGRFTHVTGSGVDREVYLRNIGRLDADSLAPQGDWSPTFDGTVVSMDASDQQDRVFAAGYFGLSNWTEETIRAGAFQASDASVIPWEVEFSNVSGGRTGYQQAVKEVDGRVWLGGSEHMLFSYDRDSMDELSTNITEKGGDFQAINTFGENLVAGCHCSENVYQGARHWPEITGFHRVEHIEQAGIWSASDGEYVPDFSPEVSLRSGYGAWAVEEASDGALWLGGDYTHARMPDASNRWTGGFVRFAAVDTEAPATPEDLSVASSAETDHLEWSAVPDATYEVLREDRVVATSSTPDVELASIEPGTRYFVRAVDSAGNRSATSPVVESGEPDPAMQPRDVLAEGGSWSYYFESDAPDAQWADPEFDASEWETGQAPLGWGHSGLGTTLEAEGTRPLTSYYRSTFEVEDAGGVESMTLTTRADDGIVVYVNGVEVGRENMPEGPVGHGSYALSAPHAADAVANPVTFDVSGALLESGTNTVTAEVHANYRTTPSVSFEMQGRLTLGEQPEPADAGAGESAPEEVPDTESGSEPEADDEPEPAPDPDDEPEPAPDPDDEPTPRTEEVVSEGDPWAFHHDEDPPENDWYERDFDDASWDTGPAPLGWGHDDLETTLPADGPQSPAVYYRTTFEVESLDDVESLIATLPEGEGVVVYVNDEEVGRANMPDGDIDHDTPASIAPEGDPEDAEAATLELSADVLEEGTNTIAVSVHSESPDAPTSRFDMHAELVRGPAS